MINLILTHTRVRTSVCYVCVCVFWNLLNKKIRLIIKGDDVRFITDIRRTAA